MSLSKEIRNQVNHTITTMIEDIVNQAVDERYQQIVETTFEKLGHQIAKERKKQKLSQRDLSELCGVSLSQVARFEQGANISFHQVKSIIRALGIDILLRNN